MQNLRTIRNSIAFFRKKMVKEKGAVVLRVIHEIVPSCSYILFPLNAFIQA